jgi:hypothetical protein
MAMATDEEVGKLDTSLYDGSMDISNISEWDNEIY